MSLQFRTHQSYVERIHDNLEQKIESIALGLFEPSCVNKGATNFTAFPVVDSRLGSGGNGDIPGLRWSLVQVWIQISGGAWQQIVLPVNSKLTSPILDNTGTGLFIQQYPFPSTLSVGQEYLTFLNKAFSIDELSPYFHGVTSMDDLGVAASGDREFVIGVNPTVTNFILVIYRDNLDVVSSQMSMYIKENSFNPVTPNPGSAYITDQGALAPPVGTPDVAGFYTGYSFAIPTAYQDATLSEDRDPFYVCTNLLPSSKLTGQFTI